MTSGIRCSHPGCLASLAWFGHAADPLLSDLAKQRGWIVSEAKGWLCRAHKPRAALQGRAL